MFVDSHAHLDSPDFQSDLEDVLSRAQEAAVETVLTIGCVGSDPGSAERILRLVERYDFLYASLGVHPHDASSFSESLGTELLGLAAHPKVLAWGEIGLDYHYQHSSPELQRLAFRTQIELARSCDKPIIIHCREAEEEVCSILEAEFPKDAARPGVLHCFTADKTTAARCLRLGFYISFGGILTFRKSESLREIARDLPGNRLLIETDAPYLAPVPHRGRRNEPSFVVQVAEELARVRGTTPEQIGALTTENFVRLFQPGRPQSGRTDSGVTVH